LGLRNPFFIFNLFVYFKHRAELYQEPRGVLRDWYLRLTSLSVVFGTTAMATLVFPRPAFIFEFVRAIWECLCLVAFGHVMTELLSIVAAPGAGYASLEQLRDRALDLASKGPPFKYYAAPPLGCLFRPIVPLRKFDSGMMTLCRRLVAQYLYIRPISGIINLWIQVDESADIVKERTGYTEATITGFIEGASMLIAMQGLFMLFWCCKVPLKDFNVGLKFLAIKLVIFLSVIQAFVLGNSIPEPPPGEFFDRESRIQLWNAALLLAESAGVSLLLFAAFPAHELRAAESLRCVGLKEDESNSLDLDETSGNKKDKPIQRGGQGYVYGSTKKNYEVMIDNTGGSGDYVKDSSEI